VIFGLEVHDVMIKKPSKFQPNIVHDFRENQDSHLQPFFIFLEIRDVGMADFWRVKAFGP
jgi:hypothetical protein